MYIERYRLFCFTQLLGHDVAAPVLRPEIQWISGRRLSQHPWPLPFFVVFFIRGVLTISQPSCIVWSTLGLPCRMFTFTK